MQSIPPFLFYKIRKAELRKVDKSSFLEDMYGVPDFFNKRAPTHQVNAAESPFLLHLLQLKGMCEYIRGVNVS
ncbi:hypothetical protein P4534_14245 [Peribacillus butanolivorans]|uniref:hypothetical protein n=1 Tax=Peribacillus butanolivorans TaxID=421767 RepID=UPI002E1EE463|nr:hypothetical protein [Peribacillus butanolivorans]